MDIDTGYRSEELGRVIRNLREMKSMSLIDASDKLGSLISPNRLSAWERGLRRTLPRPRVLQAMCELYDISMVEILAAAGYTDIARPKDSASAIKELERVVSLINRRLGSMRLTCHED